MSARRGYRSDRLRRRRRSSAERRQAWLLYVLAGLVAFGAVLGAWYAAGAWFGAGEGARHGWVVAFELTSPGQKTPVATALAVQDPAGGDPSVFVIPSELLLEGPRGEYVFAADSLAAGTFNEDLRRVIDAPIDATYRLPASDLGRWAAAKDLTLALDRPLKLDLADGLRTYQDGSKVAVTSIATLIAAEGVSARDPADMQVALWQAALDAAALRPAEAREALAGDGGASPGEGPELDRVLARLAAGSTAVTRLPSGSRVAEGQFAYVPDAEAIMAQITRRAPDYEADVTVAIRNGNGFVGAGRAAAERLEILDVNLPTPVNADSFSYRQTQILTAEQTMAVARDIHAILGRGVVLEGAGLPPATIIVIVGADFKPTQSAPKDQP